jgi:hypothetical protein
MQVWHSCCSNLHQTPFKGGLRSTGVSLLFLPRLRGGGKKKDSLLMVSYTQLLFLPCVLLLLLLLPRW